jgi:hypothetical protein
MKTLCAVKVREKALLTTALIPVSDRLALLVPCQFTTNPPGSRVVVVDVYWSWRVTEVFGEPAVIDAGMTSSKVKTVGLGLHCPKSSPEKKTKPAKQPTNR